MHVGNCLTRDLLYLRNLSTLWTSVLPFENGNSLLGMSEKLVYYFHFCTCTTCIYYRSYLSKMI